MDRRKFLQQTGASIGGFLASPQLGALTTIGAALGFASAAEAGRKREADELERENRLGQAVPHLLVRTGEAMNSAGEAFGATISGMALFQTQSIEKGRRAIAVIGHSSQYSPPHSERKLQPRDEGISVLEFHKNESRWEHAIASPQNRRFHALSETALDGARFFAEQPVHRVQKRAIGIGSIACVVATPWNTALCGSDWTLEVHPYSGVVLQKLCLGRIYPQSLHLRAEISHQLEVYALGRNPESDQKQLFKFVSHQKYHPMTGGQGATFLNMGEFFVATKPGLDATCWTSLTPQDLSTEEWEQRLMNPWAFLPETDPGCVSSENLKLFSLVEPTESGDFRYFVPETDDVLLAQKLPESTPASGLYILAPPT